MKTIIFDIDGTLTNMWPIEKSVLLCMTGGNYQNTIEELKKNGISETYKIFLKVSRKKFSKRKYFSLYNKIFRRLRNLPELEYYPTIDWIKKNQSNYSFVYATGGQKSETEYALKQFGLISFFDLENSVSKSNYRYSKKTGKPFKRIKMKYSDCFLVTDSQTDCEGAKLAKIPYYLIKPGQKLKTPFKIQGSNLII